MSRTVAGKATRGSAVLIPEKRSATASATSETVSRPSIAKSQIRSRMTPALADTIAETRLRETSSKRTMIPAHQIRSDGDRKEGSRMPISGSSRPAASSMDRKACVRRNLEDSLISGDLLSFIIQNS